MPDQFPLDKDTTPEDLSRSIKAFKEALTGSEDRFRQLVQALPAAIYFCDQAGHITFFNSAAARMWGREPEIGVDQWCGSWKIFRIDGTPLPLNECPMAVTLQQHTAVSGAEIIVERPDGTRRFVQPYPQPIFDKDGQFMGASNLLIDVTDQKIDEAKSAHLAAIISSSDDAIISKTLNGIVTSWNSSAERIFGYTAAEMVGQSISKIIPPDRANEEPEILARLKQGQRVDHFETRRLAKSGELLYISVTISPIFSSSGKIIGASKIARDITFQKELESKVKERDEEFKQTLERILRERTHELLMLNKSLEKSNHDLEQFAYIASHDLQEPLRKIHTFAELLRDYHDGLPAEQQRYLSKITDSASQMASLIRDVLDYSRLSNNRDQLVVIDLNGLLREVTTEFDLLMEQKGAALHIHHLPAVKGIPSQIKQLFRNLISNALKFCDEEPVINVHAYRENGHVQIVFNDNGIGFEQTYADQIFHIFHRLNNRGKYNGTGVGLALCKKIVENHHGNIRAESEPGKGATFFIQLPA